MWSQAHIALLRLCSWKQLPWWEWWAGCTVQVRGAVRSFRLPLFHSQVILSMTSSNNYEIRVTFIYLCVCSVAQSCQSLCDPMDCSVHGISQAIILECVPIPFSRGVFLTQGSNLVLLHWQAHSSPLPHLGSQSENVSCAVVLYSVTPRTVARQVPLSIGFPRQEYWSG